MPVPDLMAPHDLTLPPGTRLIHIGPHKTGTTAIQTAFHAGRAKLRQHGVHYAGSAEQPFFAALAVAGGHGVRGSRPPRADDWAGLVREVRQAGSQRVVVSSEFLSQADDAAARRVVTELTGGPVHVVITLRPIHKIAPSQWQQYVQNGLRLPYGAWLDGVFRRAPRDRPTPSFWRRHKHDELVRRWAGAAGPGNLTVVVADESDPGMLLRTFEAFTGLPGGSLVPTEGVANRSLTFGEIELVRRLNVEFRKRRWPDEAYARLVQLGAVRQMKTGRQPAPEEPRLPMPEWALEKSAEAGAATVEAITSLGVRIVGDLATLSKLPDAVPDLGPGSPPAGPVVPAAAAAHAVLGTIIASGIPGPPPGTEPGQARPAPGKPGLAAAEDRAVREVDARTLVRVLARRGRHRLQRAFRHRV